MDLLEATGLLETSGFEVRPWPGHSVCLRLVRTEGKETVSTPGGDIIAYRGACTLYQEGNEWVFEKWDCAPGPGPDDVVFAAESLATVVEAAIRYFAGSPTVVDGWILPVHKHPEWNAALLEESIARAEQLTRMEWFSIQQAYHTRWKERLGTKRLPGWPGFPDLTFRSIEHVERVDVRLWLRRDLMVAYIVRQVQ